MDIQITQKESAGAERHVDVSIPAEAVQAAEERTARRYASQARLPGFRPGKAPAAMVRKRFAAEIRQDTVQALVQEAYTQLMAQQKLEPITQPHIHDLKFEDGAPMTFTFHFEVRPEITLEKLDGFTVEKGSGEVTEEMLQQQLDALRDQKATWAPVEEKPAPGDMVTVELATADADGTVPAGQEYRITLGDNQAIPGIEELIMEAAPGQTVERPVKWPEDFPDEAQRGQSKLTRVTVKEVKRKTTPVLDDAFAREIGDFDSVDALTAAVREDLSANATREADAEQRAKLLDAIIDANPFEVPPTWVRQLSQSYAQAYQVPEQDVDRFAQEFRPIAERQVRRDLVVDTIAKQHQLQATEADVDAEVQQMAESRGLDAGKVYATLQKSNRLSEIEHGITERKVFEWLKERNTLG
ncbi:trigger factor [Roseisolibacter sp. H3M3-2]|uniref:trigger factor n=1 Tax=Roseisolibacter sp. H3M3-2 TaxID=3031323 RepID=UPI0023D9BF31|nr:trigger factor [Roseisolibacter sp. H3M3-2]MDF1504831.1 trigger factor [Roseisolibacter sp. H3M3-2]